MQTESQSIRITGKPDPELGICTFTISQPLMQGSYHCRNMEEAQGSPLLEKLMTMDSISQVLVQGSKLTVQKRGDQDWKILGADIASHIRECLLSGIPAVKAPVSNTESSVAKGNDKKSNQSPDEAAIQKLLDTEINPSVAGHGGHVSLVGIKDQKVILEFSGGCQGCSQAAQTVKQGIEVIIKKNFPEILGVVDVTDHALGDNPYFT